MPNFDNYRQPQRSPEELRVLAVLGDIQPNKNSITIFIDESATASELAHTIQTIEPDEQKQAKIRDEILKQAVDQHGLMNGGSLMLGRRTKHSSHQLEFCNETRLNLGDNPKLDHIKQDLMDFFQNEDRVDKELDKMMLELMWDKKLANKNFTVPFEEKITAITVADDETIFAAMEKLVKQDGNS